MKLTVIKALALLSPAALHAWDYTIINKAGGTIRVHLETQAGPTFTETIENGTSKTIHTVGWCMVGLTFEGLTDKATGLRGSRTFQWSLLERCKDRSIQIVPFGDILIAQVKGPIYLY